jgi:hypothetical protein
MATHPKRANLRVIALWMANQQNLASALANCWTIIFLVSSKKNKDSKCNWQTVGDALNAR